MISYSKMNQEELVAEKDKLQKIYNEYKEKNLNLNMSRGKPNEEQLDLSLGLINSINSSDVIAPNGTDYRNYGLFDGIPQAKGIFSEILEIKPENVIVLGNSSLSLMYDTISRGMLFGMKDSKEPWCKSEKNIFLCPSPGYDRHFGVTMDHGIEMISVPMTSNGPDMDIVEKLVKNNDSIKGIWCVPLYSNPDGITYSEETCIRLASMKTAAKDFTIMWDNSYFVHHFSETADSIPEMIGLCAKYGNPNRVYEFVSTSKITFAGAGIACVASSKENIDFINAHLKYKSIGPDKLNQLRHVKFLKNAAGVKDIMKKHANILYPKFKTVLQILAEELEGKDIAKWNTPNGGYFISLFVLPGTAKKVVSLCKESGVELTPAGATYPYGIDPDDSNIRIAPSYPPIKELIPAIHILCVSAKIAAIDKLLKE